MGAGESGGAGKGAGGKGRRVQERRREGKESMEWRGGYGRERGNEGGES